MMVKRNVKPYACLRLSANEYLLKSNFQSFGIPEKVLYSYTPGKNNYCNHYDNFKFSLRFDQVSEQNWCLFLEKDMEKGRNDRKLDLKMRLVAYCKWAYALKFSNTGPLNVE